MRVCWTGAAAAGGYTGARPRSGVLASSGQMNIVVFLVFRFVPVQCRTFEWKWLFVVLLVVVCLCRRDAGPFIYQCAKVSACVTCAEFFGIFVYGPREHTQTHSRTQHKTAWNDPHKPRFGSACDNRVHARHVCFGLHRCHKSNGTHASRLQAHLFHCSGVCVWECVCYLNKHVDTNALRSFAIPCNCIKRKIRIELNRKQN